MGCGGCNVIDRDTTAVFMCLSCEHARASRFVSCSIRGRPLVSQVCGGVLKSDAPMARPAARTPGACSREQSDCPRGPDSRGLVRWFWMRWRGVPAPLRWVLSDPDLCGLLGHDRPAAIEDFPGCGCIDRLKIWTEGLARWLGWDVRDHWVSGTVEP